MQKLISKYGLAAHLALLAVAPLFLFPFFDEGTSATVQLWLCLAAALWLLLEPSRHTGEMLHTARQRVARAVFTDPLFGLFVVLTVVAAMRWANSGAGLGVDLDTNKYCIALPPVNWLPGGVAGQGKTWFATVVSAACIVEGCRHALGKSARLSFLFTSSLLAGLAALTALCCTRCGNESAIAAVKCGYARQSFAGTAFGLYFLASLVALSGIFEHRWNRLLLVFSFAAGSTAAGAFYFSPLPVALAFAAAAILVMIGCMAYIGLYSRAANILKFFVGILFAALIPVVFATCFVPAELTELKLAFINGAPIFPEHFLEARKELAEVAFKAWRGDLWLGDGAGYFPLRLRFAAADGEWWYEEWWRLWGGIVPVSSLDGWLQILAERGIVGLASLLLPLAFMAFTYVWRLAGSIGRHSFLPLCGLGVVSVALVLAEGFLDAAPVRPDVLLALGAIFALSASAFPQRKKSEEKSEDD